MPIKLVRSKCYCSMKSTESDSRRGFDSRRVHQRVVLRRPKFSHGGSMEVGPPRTGESEWVVPFVYRLDNSLMGPTWPRLGSEYRDGLHGSETLR